MLRPIFDYKILNQFINKSISSKTDLSVLSQEIANPHGYGRVIMQDKKFLSIVEENDCNVNQKKIKLIKSLMGDGIKRPMKSEIENGHLTSFRRALYPARKILKNEG